ncbi:MAG: hypothetical protein AB7E49_04020 [Campylobacterales bacterium]
MKRRAGFGIIEAIVTIVLLSLIFATIPMLLTKATESDIASLEGEALYHASALVGRIAALPFNSAMLDGNESKIINIGGECVPNNGQLTRSASSSRLCVDLPGNPGDIDYNGELRAINQFHGYGQSLPDRGFDLNVTIGYLNESGTWGNWTTVAGPTNLLLITVTATHATIGETIGTLRYVASNIGALQ